MQVSPPFPSLLSKSFSWRPDYRELLLFEIGDVVCFLPFLTGSVRFAPDLLAGESKLDLVSCDFWFLDAEV